MKHNIRYHIDAALRDMLPAIATQLTADIVETLMTRKPGDPT